MKFSKQRELILNEIISSNVHPTADTIYTNLKKDNPELSLGTVYRNLSQLTKKGIISKLSIPNQSDRFDKKVEPHSHLICQNCNNIYDIDSDSICKFINELSSEKNLSITNYDLVLYGTCDNCNK